MIYSTMITIRYCDQDLCLSSLKVPLVLRRDNDGRLRYPPLEPPNFALLSCTSRMLSLYCFGVMPLPNVFVTWFEHNKEIPIFNK